MRGLREACVVCSANDYAEAIYFKEFLKWTGFSFFIYIDNEQNAELNSTITKETGRFDFILYIGDKDRVLEARCCSLTDIHVHVPSENIWKAENGKGGTMRWRLRQDLLRNAWKEICQCLIPVPSASLNQVMDALIRVYCDKKIVHRLVDNRYSTLMLYAKLSEKKGMENRSGSGTDAQKIDRYGGWKKAIDKLEELNGTFTGDTKVCGKEYLEYALCYCYRKVNEYCNLHRMDRVYETGWLLDRLDQIYHYDKEFYMIENLKAKVASLDSEYKTFAISYLYNCTRTCRVGLCNSFHYYRLGKQFEHIRREEEAANSFRYSYQTNELNFRAQFKLAASWFHKQEWDKASMELKGILDILQLNSNGEAGFIERLNLLPPLELEYASKCYVLLGSIEDKQQKRKSYMQFCYGRVEQIKNCVETNDYLKQMYPDPKERQSLLLHMEGRLTKRAIEEKMKVLSGAGAL